MSGCLLIPFVPWCVFFYIRLIKQNTLHREPRTNEPLPRPKIPFYGLASRFTHPLQRLAWLQGGRGRRAAGCRGRGRRLGRHETLHPLMAEMRQRGDGNCLDGGKTRRRREGGREGGGVQSEKWEWCRVTMLLKTLVCSTQAAAQANWCYKNKVLWGFKLLMN